MRIQHEVARNPIMESLNQGTPPREVAALRLTIQSQWTSYGYSSGIGAQLCMSSPGWAVKHADPCLEFQSSSSKLLPPPMPSPLQAT